jgi:hypothetical protein
LDIG